MIMKNLSLLSLFLLVFAVPRLQAVTNPATEMTSFRSAVSNTLFLATNEVASPDKKAVAALKRALVVLGKADVEDIASDAKALSSAVGTLSRSSVSNRLHGAIGNVMEYFYFIVLDGAGQSPNRLTGRKLLD